MQTKKLKLIPLFFKYFLIIAFGMLVFIIFTIWAFDSLNELTSFIDNHPWITLSGLLSPSSLLLALLEYRKLPPTKEEIAEDDYRWRNKIVG